MLTPLVKCIDVFCPDYSNLNPFNLSSTTFLTLVPIRLQLFPTNLHLAARYITQTDL